MSKREVDDIVIAVVGNHLLVGSIEEMFPVGPGYPGAYFYNIHCSVDGVLIMLEEHPEGLVFSYSEIDKAIEKLRAFYDHI